MTLNRLTERIWLYPFEEERDRPNLSYIRGDKWSIAVDAGHSGDHTREFYKALEDAGLPLPRLTVLTHWHWDHTLGMHAVQGLTLANRRTDEHLKEFEKRLAQKGGREAHLNLHESIRREYTAGKPLIVTRADLIFDKEMRLNAGNCPVRVFHTEAPHTDDSTLIYAEGEKVLFIGDAACGAFPAWEKDKALCEKLKNSILETEAELCLESHWTPLSTEETVRDLMSPEG